MSKTLLCVLFKHSWDSKVDGYGADLDRITHTCERCGCKLHGALTPLPSRPSFFKAFGNR